MRWKHRYIKVFEPSVKYTENAAPFTLKICLKATYFFADIQSNCVHPGFVLQPTSHNDTSWLDSSCVSRGSVSSASGSCGSVGSGPNSTDGSRVSYGD